MALTDEGGMGVTMPVSPMNYGGNGFGFGGDWAWIILLLLLGWGNNGWGNGYGGGMGAGFVDNSVQRGFDQSAIMGSLGDISGAICSGFAGVEASANARQIADMQNSFALQSQLASCCCNNQLATADLKYTVATENCADRQVVSDGIRDLLAATQAQTTTILNQLCADKLEQKNDIINQLRSELLYARGQASQDVQTAAIQAGQRALANEVEQYVAPKPIPSYTVQNPNCCTTGCGVNCGCGM